MLAFSYISHEPKVMLLVVFACDGFVYEEQTFFPSLATVITQRGLGYYLFGAYTEFTSGIVGKPLFNEVKLGVMGFDLTISELVIKEITTSDLEPAFQEDQLLELRAANISLQLHFGFTLQQTVFPYLSDQGEGTISLSNATFIIRSQFVPLENCMFNFKLDPHYSNLNIQKLRMKMSGGFAFLYDSILAALADKFKELLNSQFGEELVNVIIGAANTALSAFDMRLESSKTGYLSDSSFLGVPHIVDRTMQLAQIGEVMRQENGTIIRILNDSVERRFPPTFLTNNDVQTFISILTFRSAFEAYLFDQLHYFEIGGVNYQLVSIDSVRFTKTGMLFAFTFVDVDTGHRSMIEFLQKVTFEVRSSHSIRHLVDFGRIISCGGQLCVSDELPAVLQKIHREMGDLWFVQGKVQVFDLPTCNYIYLDDSWLFFGCNITQRANLLV